MPIRHEFSYSLERGRDITQKKLLNFPLSLQLQLFLKTQTTYRKCGTIWEKEAGGR